MSELFRDGTIGQLINKLSNGRILPYDDQRPGWKSPIRTLNSSQSTLKDPGEDKVLEDGLASNIVGWYDDNDQDNPMNWSLGKRMTVVGLLCFLTFCVYIGSAIYTPSIPGVMEHFHTSHTKATLGLSLYVIAYGMGPLLFSPLSEVPSIGRNPIYIATFFIFVILQIPTIYAKNLPTALAMRFLAGFVGSPALATGGATIQDMFPTIKLPRVIILWGLAGVCGPVLGPVIGGFAAEFKDWRWPVFELLWMSSFAFVLLVCFLPETSPQSILLKRARRLRAATGNQRLCSESEIMQANMSASAVLFDYLLRPFQLMTEPALLYANIYISLVYAIFYLWFESFPLVYVGIYHFSLGESGLPFLGFIVTCIPTAIAYVTWNYYILEANFKATGTHVPESRLAVALVASFFIPASLLIFGWTAKANIHWIVPTIGASLYFPGLFLLFQTVLVYLATSYPKYSASVLAGNSLFRSLVAGSFPLFGKTLYTKLTIGGGTTLLAGLSLALTPGLWGLYRYGSRLRARSRFAVNTVET